MFAPFIDIEKIDIRQKKEKAQENQSRASSESADNQGSWQSERFCCRESGGLAGAAVGYAISNFWRPVAGAWFMFGYRIGDIVAKTFAKAVGERIAKRNRDR